jgi:hypothetical protein
MQYDFADHRFNKIFGKEIKAKRPINLYQIDFNLSNIPNHHAITVGDFPVPVIGNLPAGHTVIFDKIARLRGYNGGDDSLLGTTVFKGKTYPVVYWLGFRNDETISGWTAMYKDFNIDDYHLLP